MEFEELKKIWNAQDNQPLYAINEKAMYNLILSKKKQAHHITDISELLLIFVNLSSGIMVLGMNYFKQSGNISLYILSAWMLGLCEGGRAIWIAIVMTLFFALTYFAGGWEHSIYKRKKRELEILQKKLDTEG